MGHFSIGVIGHLLGSVTGLNVLWKLALPEIHIDTNLLSARESFLKGRHECPEKKSPGEGKVRAEFLLWVECWPETVINPHPCAPKCPDTSVPKSAYEAGLVWEGDPVYLDEEHSATPPYWKVTVWEQTHTTEATVSSRSVPGVSAGLSACSSWAIFHWPPGTEGRRAEFLPCAFHPLHWIYCCGSVPWLAQQNWPALPTPHPRTVQIVLTLSNE